MEAWARWAMVLGFSIGGFFDGILLHQILQWHHLLSLVPKVDTLREQVLWDGYFHAVMYVAAALGLWGLWRTRDRLAANSASTLAAALLIGFGAWHIVDSILSHWLLGIHRIRLDSPDPLKWDLIWFFAFGAVPVLAGWLLMRRRHGPPPRSPRRNAARTVLLTGLVTTGIGLWSLQPPPDQRFTTIVFAPWVTGADAIAVIATVDARIIWASADMAVLVASVPAQHRLGLYRKGALLVSGAGPGGCIGWSRGAA